MNKQIVFLDRDGTIIEDKSYMHKVEDLEFIDNSIDGLKMLQKTHELVIVTNQSGINRGKFDYKKYSEFNEKFLKKLEENGIEMKASLFCPHAPKEKCECRKPKIKLIENYLEEQKISLNKKNCYVIGDKTCDIKLAENLGIRGILVKTGKGGSDSEFETKPHFIADNLFKAVEHIIKNGK
tara:strand:- start:265 stop:807 length:543 start_codon:yes stop_codon:yes gene_type:complete